MQFSNIDPENGDALTRAVLDAAAAITGKPASSASRLTVGGNNVTLMIETADGSFVAKHYPRTSGDDRDRFEAEAGALRFLNQAGFTCVPELIGADADARVCVMTNCGAPTGRHGEDADIDACIDFARQLHDARKSDAASGLPAAAEATPAPRDVTAQVGERRDRLGETAKRDPVLLSFLRDEFDPVFVATIDQVRGAFAVTGKPTTAPLAANLQTLSPSDFGFHNTVRGADGALTFVDFEYFGWDDPVRLVSDFVLHPGHDLSDAQKKTFLGACHDIYGAEDRQYRMRLRTLFPLVGLRWCMILLNEFLPERMERRRAAGNNDDLDGILAGQLEKARQLLSGIDDNKRLLTD